MIKKYKTALATLATLVAGYGIFKFVVARTR